MKLYRTFWALLLAIFISFANAAEHSALKEESVISNKVYKINPSTYEGYNSLYEKCIAGVSDAFTNEFSDKKNLVISPGRSCVLLIDPLKAQGCSVANPSFSKGNLVLGVPRLSEHKDIGQNSLKQKELQEKLDKTTMEELQCSKNLTNCIKDYEDLPFYPELHTRTVKPSHSFVISNEQITGYRVYLKETCGLSPQIMGQTKGKIVLFDSVCSGGSMGGFIKILVDWCMEEGMDITDKIAVANFNYKIRETPIFEKNNPLAAYWNSMVYFIVPESVWRDFSYNRVDLKSERHFFFPPWVWDQPQLWMPEKI